MRIKVDFSSVSDEEFEPLPPDAYECEVYDVEKRNTESGNPYLAWTFKVVEGQYKGRHLWLNTSLLPQALWKLRAILKRLGVEVPKGVVEIDLLDLLERRCQLVVDIETWQGVERNRVVDVYPSTTVAAPAKKKEKKEELEDLDDIPF